MSRPFGTRTSTRSVIPSLKRTEPTQDETALNNKITEADSKKKQVIRLLEKVPTCRTGPINCNQIRRKKEQINNFFEHGISGNISHYSTINSLDGLEKIIKLCDIYIDNLENYTKTNGLYEFEKNIKDSNFGVGINYLAHVFQRHGGKNKTQKRRKSGKTRKSRK